SLDLRYGLLRREESSFGLAIDVEPHWGRVDEITGARADRYGASVLVAVDKEVAPSTVAVANLFYEPEAARARATSAWPRDAVVGTSPGMMTATRPDGPFIGGEVRYLRRYEAIDLGAFAGQALFVGPSMYAKLSERCWLAAGWSFQVAGKAAGETGWLDLSNFERHQATLKFGVGF